ncbi:aminotransferase class I/II-fold pyridoxal phosphate-dependent enzyme [Breoghania sp.]|uniref:pyridoxal phosphate-dependent aminotransferase n=1 Tax=Breoghania sp. TaxID=2065378 RepID=UPI002AA7CA7A|nr:aminotransferase class I/II-fold pyridoxal phosphate-dependent enzyme [Breoghania sp.]
MTLNSQNTALASTRLYEAETSLETLAVRYGLDPREMFDFSLNVNPFGPPQAAVKAAAEALGATNYYPDLNYSILRTAISDHFGIGGGQLFFGAGLDDVIKLILQAWTSEGDAVLVHLPTFPRYALEASLRGCRVVGIRSEPAGKTDLGRLDAEMKRQAIALAFICTPNNPTGEIIPTEDIAALATANPDTLIVVDEALINPANEGAIHLPERLDNVVVLRTFSKFYGLAGLRIGYAVASPRLVDVANVGRPPFNVALPSLAAAAAALGDSAFVERCAAIFAEESAYFRSEIAKMDGLSLCGGHGNMQLVELAAMSSASAADKLARQGIVVADATSFEGLEKSATLRISLRTHAENVRLVAALGTL